MGCPHTGCANNSIHGMCRYSGNPKTCAYGKDARREETLHQRINRLRAENRRLKRALASTPNEKLSGGPPSADAAGSEG